MAAFKRRRSSLLIMVGSPTSHRLERKRRKLIGPPFRIYARYVTDVINVFLNTFFIFRNVVESIVCTGSADEHFKTLCAGDTNCYIYVLDNVTIYGDAGT